MNTNAAVSSVINQIKTVSHTLHSLLSELKSLFFYEENSTLRDQLRSIVYKYETLAQNDTAMIKRSNE